jgi:uncharacterized protein (TIGR02996 family)
MSDERAFLQAILEQPGDDGRKLVYADWLEEQGDPRGEFLRLIMQVRQQRVVTSEQRQRHQELSAELAELRAESRRAWNDRRGRLRENRRRIQEIESQLTVLSRRIRKQVPVRLQELAATLDPNWLAIVSDPDIEGCGKSGEDDWRLDFVFVCDKTWADLKTTDDQTVRHCVTCSKNVHFCDTIVDAREHASQGHCIAVDLGVLRREGDLASPRGFTVGIVTDPVPPNRHDRDVDAVSQARLDARKRTRKR